MAQIPHFYFSNGIKTEEYSERTWSKEGVPIHINKYGQEIETNMYMKKDFEAWLANVHNAEVRERQVCSPYPAYIMKQPGVSFI